uniref:Uncharacterized protein n=1 Tax=Amphimedon queenslandica TaxID=400682 RepID=A0A1X7V0P4_AMPQE
MTGSGRSHEIEFDVMRMRPDPFHCYEFLLVCIPQTQPPPLWLCFRKTWTIDTSITL